MTSTFSERLAQALRIRKMKQSELCQIAKLPKSSVSQYLSSNFIPRRDRVRSIAIALNVNEAWLYGYDVPMERELPNDDIELNEGEKQLLNLFRQMQPDKQELALHIFRFVVGSQG